MTRLPMFPLGTVLVPTAVLPLHIFEPRYLQLMDDITDGAVPLPGDSPALDAAVGAGFGVVLIERGSEVGGGDVRMTVGTVARLLESRRFPDGRWLVAAVGTRRIRIERWLPDDPYPLADVEDLDDSGWADPDERLVVEAGRMVRRALGMVAELGEGGAQVTFELADDPVVASWQLCALAPIGPHDRQRLLETGDPTARLEQVLALTGDVAATLAFRLGQEP